MRESLAACRRPVVDPNTCILRTPGALTGLRRNDRCHGTAGRRAGATARISDDADTDTGSWTRRRRRLAARSSSAPRRREIPDRDSSRRFTKRHRAAERVPKPRWAQARCRRRCGAFTARDGMPSQASGADCGAALQLRRRSREEEQIRASTAQETMIFPRRPRYARKDCGSLRAADLGLHGLSRLSESTMMVERRP